MRHADLVELILQFEDLKDEERELATQHLDQCDECLTLLIQLQNTEHEALSPGDMAPLPPDPDGDPAGGLRGEDLRQAQASRMALLKRVRQVKRSRRLNPLGWGGLGVAVAACLVVVLWSPWQQVPQGLIQDFRLAPTAVTRGAEAAELQVGEAFAVRFTLAEAGWPVVVTLGPNGAADVLYPWSLETAVLAADRPLVLPPTGAPVTWRLRAPETTVWLALDREGALDPVKLREDLAGIRSAAKMTAYLTDRFGAAAVSVATLSAPDSQ